MAIVITMQVISVAVLLKRKTTTETKADIFKTVPMIAV